MSADTGVVRGESCLHIGRQMAFGEGKLLDTKGRLLAHGATTCHVVREGVPKENYAVQAFAIPTELAVRPSNEVSRNGCRVRCSASNWSNLTAAAKSRRTVRCP